MKALLILFFLTFGLLLQAQEKTSENKKLKFNGDFRFRIEEDWNSHNSEGIKRQDRSRLRYRMRFGLNYQLDENSSFGARVRTGNINDQQGPHVTIGSGGGEFGLVNLGFEKLFYKYKSKRFTGWVGKNSIPLKKVNELFWNDNVFPEGVGLNYKIDKSGSKMLQSIALNAGHFIIHSNNRNFNDDSYLQILQLETNLFNNKVSLFPGIYFFNEVGNIPDGQETFNFDYTILHLGGLFTIPEKPNVKLGVEYYNNLSDYTNIEEITEKFKDEKKGLVISAKYGKLKEKGDWIFHAYYANLQKYAVLDYFAQNDWARWDYSSSNALGSRLTNFHGVELRLGYAVKKNFNLILRSYMVEELVKTGSFREDGSRIRLDLDIKF